MSIPFSLVNVPACEKDALRRLLELYIYDFSEFLPIDVNEDGYYGYEYLDEYWSDPVRHPYFIKVEGKLAGFVLVRSFPDSNDEPVFTIAEFFIMKRYRRHGIGKAVAHEIFRVFPGKWEVFQISSNLPAQAFWRKTIAEYTQNDFSEHEEEGKVYQTFVSITSA
ncbi:GNAT family N-acetyltransferase [Brevibacillus sp. SIMBA_040]|uniref:GNAT family N-acetyltransferase n=1 Tax=unclassified Brevibacillus TaxID=2684853 RepID=UPI00397C3A26